MLILVENRQSQKILIKMKSLDTENIFCPHVLQKLKKLTAVGLFKVESVLSKSLKLAKNT
jgi:hypothetical protein